MPRASFQSTRAVGIVLLALTLAAACAPAAPSAPSASAPRQEPVAAAPAASRPKILTIAIPSEPSGMSDKLFQAASDIDQVFQSSLMYLDGTDVPRPLLAARQPSQDDGSWVVNPDSTMLTTYTLKPDLKWQDGHAMTADDFAFAYSVYSDPQVPVSVRLPESLMSNVVARDPQTIDIFWKQPYVGAGSLATRELAPQPRHILGDLYAQDKDAFLKSTFWTSPEYVGSGPFRLTDWEKGVALTLVANPYFALGKPAIDIVRVVFVADANTLAARILAGAVDVSPTATINTALLLKERWEADKGGEVYTISMKVRRLYFQFRDVTNHQKAVLDVRVRRALLHVIDRDALATAVEGSFGMAADSPYPPGARLYPAINAAIAKYPYDLSRAQALFRDSGWTAGSDGMLRDGNGRTLDMELRTAEDQDASIVADFWKRAGINSTPIVISGVNRRDDEYRASFPAAQLQSGSGGYLTNLYTAIAPSPANGFRGSNNRGTYSNPEFDRLFNLQVTTLDQSARDQILVDLEKIITTDVAVGYLMYDPSPLVARSVVKGIRNVTKETGNPFFNIFEWSMEDQP